MRIIRRKCKQQDITSLNEMVVLHLFFSCALAFIINNSIKKNFIIF